MRSKISFKDMRAIELACLVTNRSNPVSTIFDPFKGGSSTTGSASASPSPTTRLTLDVSKLQEHNVSEYYLYSESDQESIKLDKIFSVNRDQSDSIVIYLTADEGSVEELLRPAEIIAQIMKLAVSEQRNKTTGPRSLYYFLENAREDGDDIYLVTGITSVKKVIIQEYFVQFHQLGFSGTIPLSKIIQAATGVPVDGVDPTIFAQSQKAIVRNGSRSFEDERIFLVHYLKTRFKWKKRSMFMRDEDAKITDAALETGVPELKPSIVRKADLDEFEETFTLELEEGSEEKVAMMDVGG